jgi:hypothetical protein
MRIRRLLLVFAITALLFTSDVLALKLDAGDVDDLIAQLDDSSSDTRKDAAESLSQTVDPKKISPAIRIRLEKESDFQVKLALHYALASQGEKESLSFLIDSLKESGHLGYRYLCDITGQDFGWNASEYREWYKKTNVDQFREFINERWRRKPMRDEYAEFCSLFGKQTMSSMRLVETGKLFNLNYQLTDADRKRLSEIPTAKSWDIFIQGLTALDEQGDRKQAAKLFLKIVNEYPDTYYADQARELSNLLNEMIIQDSEFTIPDNFTKLELNKRIAVHIHFLRDARAFQFSQPGSCQLSFYGTTVPGNVDYNPALALYEIGEPAADALSDYLNDRRPIRGIGCWRNFRPSRRVLRYGDAAEQIIQKIN